MSTDRILGRGVRFPFRPGATGGFAFVEGQSNVEQSMRLILSTATGERQMRFDFGSQLPRAVFQPITAATIGRIQESARQALVSFERRITVLSVTAAADPDVESKVIVTVDYEISRTSRRGNLVFPFFLESA